LPAEWQRREIERTARPGAAYCGCVATLRLGARPVSLGSLSTERSTGTPSATASRPSARASSALSSTWRRISARSRSTGGRCSTVTASQSVWAPARPHLSEQAAEHRSGVHDCRSHSSASTPDLGFAGLGFAGLGSAISAPLRGGQPAPCSAGPIRWRSTPVRGSRTRSRGRGRTGKTAASMWCSPRPTKSRGFPSTANSRPSWPVASPARHAAVHPDAGETVRRELLRFMVCRCDRQGWAARRLCASRPSEDSRQEAGGAGIGRGGYPIHHGACHQQDGGEVREGSESASACEACHGSVGERPMNGGLWRQWETEHLASGKQCRTQRICAAKSWRSLGESNPSFQIENLTS
jgi:hypothetical protein